MPQKKLDVSGVNDVPHYQEDLVEYGGAAVIQMILGCDKVGLSPLPTQADLYSYAVSKNDPTEPPDAWHIDPQGLTETLMYYKPASFANTFVEFSRTDQDEVNHKIRYTIDVYEVPPAALVQGGSQWLAVTGYRTTSDDELQAFFIHDPRPPITDGTGDPPFHEVSADTWNGSYYFRSVVGGARWLNNYVIVRDPKIPPGQLRAAKAKPWADGSQIIDPKLIIEYTQEILQERGTLDDEMMARAIEESSVVRTQLVQRLDRDDQFYYLVRYIIGSREIAVVAIDARFATFMEAIAYHKPLRFFKFARVQIPRILERGFTAQERLADVRNRIVNRLLQRVNPNQPGLIPGMEVRHLHRILDEEIARSRQPARFRRYRKVEISVHPTMVWQPSVESMSPLYPFYLVNTPKQSIYMRAADGMMVADLTPFWLQRLGG